MNMLDRFLGHDLAATREMLQLCLSLTDEQMDCVFDAGWGTLRKTFNHMISNIETWTDLMMSRPVRSMSGDSAAQLLQRLEQSYADFAAFARKIEDEGRLDELFTDVLDNPPVQKSIGGAIGHLITHNMHHRAEVLHMMHRLGMQNLPEGDLMGWDQRTRTANKREKL
jgi:uncharacterized damage-inducible protein DinB